MHNNTTYVVNPCKSDEIPNTKKYLTESNASCEWCIIIFTCTPLITTCHLNNYACVKYNKYIHKLNQIPFRKKLSPKLV